MRGRALLLAVPLAAALVRPGGATMAFELESSAFKAGETIPRKHTCDGEDRSPPLAWTDPPPGTKSFVLVCDDPDAPAGTWVHWVLYGVPCPPRGASHRYYFRLYALDVVVGLPPGATKAALMKAVEGHTLGQTEL